MIAIFLNQKCRVAKTKPVVHSAFKFGREGKCVTLICVHPQDTGDVRIPAKAAGEPTIAQVTGSVFILRLTIFILRLTINVVIRRYSRTKVVAFWQRIAAIVIGMMRNLPSCARREGAGADA